MQTVLDVDDKLLSLAEQRARRDGKSLGALVEDALRVVLRSAQPIPAPGERTVEFVEADDAFFSALEEIRALGRSPASLRQIPLP